MPNRDFDASRRERDAELDPIEFTLNDYTFHCAPTLPWTAYEHILEIADGPAPPRHAGRVTTAGVKSTARISMKVGPFLRACVIDDDQEALDEVLSSRVNPVDMGTITDVCNWLIEVYTGRPTVRPVESSTGPSDTSRTLRAVSTDSTPSFS